MILNILGTEKVYFYFSEKVPEKDVLFGGYIASSNCSCCHNSSDSSESIKYMNKLSR